MVSMADGVTRSKLCSSAGSTCSVAGSPKGCPLIWAWMLTSPARSILTTALYVPLPQSCRAMSPI